MEGIAFILVVVIGLAFYFVPTMVAFNREHRQKVAILVLNFCLGWTLLGWVGALVWSLLNDDRDF